MRLALVALPFALAVAALAQPAEAATAGYDCTLRDAAEEWTGPNAIRFEIDADAQRAAIADLGSSRTWTYASRPAENYTFKVMTDEFGSHLGTGFVHGESGFLDAIQIETQTGRMLWIDMRLDLHPARTIWACTPA